MLVPPQEPLLPTTTIGPRWMDGSSTGLFASCGLSCGNTHMHTHTPMQVSFGTDTDKNALVGRRTHAHTHVVHTDIAS